MKNDTDVASLIRMFATTKFCRRVEVDVAVFATSLYWFDCSCRDCWLRWLSTILYTLLRHTSNTNNCIICCSILCRMYNTLLVQD